MHANQGPLQTDHPRPDTPCIAMTGDPVEVRWLNLGRSQPRRARCEAGIFLDLDLKSANFDISKGGPGRDLLTSKIAYSGLSGEKIPASVRTDLLAGARDQSAQRTLPEESDRSDPV